jgi:glycosyltransferase involved in cell wall biosynthesis
VKACFLLPDLQLSGGVGVVLRHAWHLRRDPELEVSILLTDHDAKPAPYGLLADLDVRPIEDLPADARFDVAVATWWQTAYRLFEVPAERYGYFVQSLEDRFYLGDDPVERGAVALTYDMPVTFITEARWIQDFLAALRPDTQCHYVRNGVDKEVFAPPERIEARPPGSPLRVLIEGNPDHWLKAVPDALEAVARTERPMETTLVSPRPLGDRRFAVDRQLGPLREEELAAEYAAADVVVKLSRVEGMFGPPLEGFHKGATCLVTPVTGHEEYVVRGHNGIVCDFDDLDGTARWLDLLQADREFTETLRANALETAKAWPSWEEAAAEMTRALRAVAEAEPADPHANARAIMRHAWSLAEASRAEMLRRRSRAEWIEKQLAAFHETRGYKVATALQRLKRRLTPGRRGDGHSSSSSSRSSSRGPRRSRPSGCCARCASAATRCPPRASRCGSRSSARTRTSSPARSRRPARGRSRRSRTSATAPTRTGSCSACARSTPTSSSSSAPSSSPPGCSPSCGR